MIGATGPVSATAILGLWANGAESAPETIAPLLEQGRDPQVWLVEIGTRPDAAGSGPAPIALLAIAAAPVGTPDRPEGVDQAAPVFFLSDRGWIGEPGDTTAPNVAYPPRLAAPPAMEAFLPIYPDSPRRLAPAVGELTILNGDGAYDAMAGDWTVSGQQVLLLMGPHRRPLHAPRADFLRVATLRAAGAAEGTSRLVIPLRPSAADLDIPVCNTYAGTGGAEGGSTLAGQAKPRLYGIKRNVEPVALDTALLIYQLHDGPIYAVLAVRDRGVALSFAGDLPSYSALAAAAVFSGTYKTCLSAGVLRVGATPSSLTVDARGDADMATGGYNTGSAAGIARKLLFGPGGITSTGGWGFDWDFDWGGSGVGDIAWPVGEAGLWLRGGTVAAALDLLAAGVVGWWGADRAGTYEGGQLTAPELQTPAVTIAPWMLAAPPEEVGPARAPWWRVRVGYRALGRVQTDEQIAGSVTAGDRDSYATAWRTAVALDTGISAAYPAATDGPEVVSAFEELADAQAMADYLLGLFGRPRRMFQVSMRSGAGGYAWPTIRPGACVALQWPRHRALANARPMVVQGVSSRGDAVTLTLWG